MKKYTVALTSALLISFCWSGVLAQSGSFKPKNGFVSDEKTAVRVGEAILADIYGERQIASERPFSAKLKNGIWIVTGTFPKGQRFGGVAEIRISKTDGCVLSATHGQ
ncbi:MAG: YbbC/YhhH family protein [Candidatus Acidiferrales bacterium]